MAESVKVSYIVVEDGEKEDEKETSSFRYTRPVLQSTLQLMGCKARHAFKISQRVFEMIRSEPSCNTQLQVGADALRGNSEKEDGCLANGNSHKVEVGNSEKDEKSRSISSESNKKRTTIVVSREMFLDIVCDSLAEYRYIGHNQRADLVLACRVRERKESVTVLLCGTSGCGKSTLSALLASRLGITTVISTDSIRHMMRSFVDEKQNPLLWASTYHAGECLDPEAVAEAKNKRKAKKLAVNEKSLSNEEAAGGSAAGSLDVRAAEVSPKQMAVEGFKAQSEMVIDSLDRLITSWEERNESVVVEGVHLSLNFVMGLMKKHPSIIPFMIYITSEDKHLERFAVRAKYMTLDPAKNKYVKYIKNIRTIQEYLCKRADKHLVPKINNTNVDKSVASIHATVFSCLRRREAGEQLYDPSTHTVCVVEEEYRNQCAANSLSSKGMFQLIQRKGSSRHLMALLNTDGTVAKTWPVDSQDINGRPVLSNGNEAGRGNPMYGPLKIGKAEPVNLPFGLFGISAWPSDGGTSRAGSVDESRGDGTDTGSRYLSSYQSSCCSSPRTSEVHSKELKEDLSVHGSDEEADDDQPEAESDDDLTDDDNEKLLDEEVGSVDEEYTKSDEEYDDLAMQDLEENGYWTEDDEEARDKVTPIPEDQGDKYNQNLDAFLKTSSRQKLPVPLRSYSSLHREKKERKLAPHSNAKMRRRSLSIPAAKNQRTNMNDLGAVINDPILSGSPQR